MRSRSENERTGPRQEAGPITPPAAIVSDAAARERARRRWRIQSIGRRRRISVALDRLCGLEVAPLGEVQIDYERCGLTLGWAERVAVGRAGLGVAA